MTNSSRDFHRLKQEKRFEHEKYRENISLAEKITRIPFEIRGVPERHLAALCERTDSIDSSPPSRTNSKPWQEFPAVRMQSAVNFTARREITMHSEGDD
jgi:hypothetical protein